MTQREYTDELKLIERQNNYEFDLYFVIADLIKERPNIIKDRLSVRAVFNRIRSELGQVFYGLSNFPDFAILDSDFSNQDNAGPQIKNINQIYGCIEIKALGTPLLDMNSIVGKTAGQEKLGDHEGQLLGDVLWYRKVLYTNGCQWKYYEWDPKKEEFDYIKATVEERIKEEEIKKGREFDWYQHMDFRQLNLGKIREKFHILDVQNTNLQTLTDQIDQIKWK